MTANTRKDVALTGEYGSIEWWRGAAIYQIYPRSFFDTNGDGIGDLPGITAKLDYVASLGVDAIWISPFFTSPMADYGYDVADYRDVDPSFGTLADFDALVARAHQLGLKVTIDLVFAHTSDQHAWFSESRATRTNPKADWYLWSDPNPDGTPPNNWQSVFGGPGWTWDARRRQYYMHQFLKEQPQLNVHSPDVQDALLDVVRFWLTRGVDGFRFDALNHAMYDPQLRDNGIAQVEAAGLIRPFYFQNHNRSQNHPAIVGFIERIRQVCDGFGDIFTVAEVGGPNVTPLMKAYTAGGERLSSAYSFDFLFANDLKPQHIKATLAQWPGQADESGPNAGKAEGWPSWAFDNHDAPRSVSRWCGPDAAPDDMDRFARMEIALLAGLRGNIFIYQGQELGLEQDDIPFHLLKDPEAIANWPLTLSRDGVRTPMPWANERLGGFTDSTPWLPLSFANTSRAVSVQHSAPGSLLNWTRHVIHLRGSMETLRSGAMSPCSTRGDMLSFDRLGANESIHCVFNLGPAWLKMPQMLTGKVMLATTGADAKDLPPYGVIWLRRNAGESWA